MTGITRQTALLLTLCLWLNGPAQGESLSESAKRMQADVKILASDEFEGRGVGTDGLEKAAQYLAEEFAKAGLKLDLAGGDPFQEFEITDGAELGSPNTLTLHGPDGATIPLELGRDFEVCSFGTSGEFSAPVVFAGYGIDASDAEYNDFASVDVKGKVVIVMRRNPFQANPHGPFAVSHGISRHAALTSKLSQAFTKGAVAVLFVNEPYTGRHEREQLDAKVNEARAKVVDLARKIALPEANVEEQRAALKNALTHLDEVAGLVEKHNADPLMPFGYGGTRAGKSIPCFHLAQAAVNQLLDKSIKSGLAELEAAIDRTGKPASCDLPGWSASGQATVKLIRRPVKNVIGLLEGNGPLKDETIVIGAHFDHLGYGGEGSLAPHSMEIHNGADDNASGTAGLLELARRLGRREQPLPRSILFLAFTGEERGLLGAEEYVKNPLVPLERTVAMLNMDMIGRLDGDKLTVFGTGTSTRWNELVDALSEPLNLKIAKKPEGFGPSDHSAFYAKKIPVLHLFTGTHSDYHRPGDDWDKINVEGMDRIVTLMEQLTLDVAMQETRPDYLEVKGTASIERTGSRPYFGSIPDFGTEAEGYAIQGVSPDSPAEKGGLKGGDVIVEFGGNRIGGLDDFDLALRKFSPGEQVEIVVLRKGERVTVKVTLGTPRS